MKVIKGVIEFEWDQGNIGKNKKHKVEDKETEEVFLDENKVIYRDLIHSKTEDRFIILGRTVKERLLFVSFTYRKNKVRVISVRNINKKEVKLYEKAT